MHLREDSTCLNCGNSVIGRYCSNCGQENVELKEPFWKILSHFIGDYFHFDSKLFRSLVPLLFKPGFLTNEFIEGKRVKYIHPFRMYIFISIVFFIIYLVILKSSPNEKSGLNLTFSVDSSLVKTDTIETRTKGRYKVLTGEDFFRLNMSLEEYNDSIAKLPEDKKPGWLEDYVSRKTIEINQMGSEKFLSGFAAGFLGNLPKLMFFLLPVVAMWLKLLYIRHKEFLYLEHLIFSLHVHSFLFLALLVQIPLQWIWGRFDIIIFIIILVYFFVAVLKVYKQKFGKSFFKFILLNVLYLITLFVCFLANIIITLALLH